MGDHFRTPELFHPGCDSAKHPIEPPWRVAAALLHIAGISPQRRHALPARPMTAPLGASNCGF